MAFKKVQRSTNIITPHKRKTPEDQRSRPLGVNQKRHSEIKRQELRGQALESLQTSIFTEQTERNNELYSPRSLQCLPSPTDLIFQISNPQILLTFGLIEAV